MKDLKLNIKNSIISFNNGKLFENSISLFETLGYNTARQNRLDDNSFSNFKNNFIDADDNFNKEKAFTNDWVKIELLFQLTNEEVTGLTDMFSSGKVDNTIIESYLFFAVELSGTNYSRTKLSSITREINKLFSMPVMILFFYDEKLTLSVINRRLHKRDSSKDVLEKVMLIKDIRTANPHRAHIEILYDLSFPVLADTFKVTNFVELHRAWEKILDTKELNKKFFKELSNWYFWAINEVEFPDDAEKEKDKRNPISVIRLITRLMFVWFIKEKGLVPEQIFDKKHLDTLLNYNDLTGSTYYKAILQNLFFATLNTEMNKDKPNSRKFVNGQYLVHNLYRYGNLFNDKTGALKLFENIPFLNGGLFECLDRKDENDNVIRIDCFSENPKNQKRLKVPDYLFFGEEQIIDLSDAYGNKKKSKEKVRPIIDILNSYKFTIAENTPIEEEVALDPELLGKVFENLLASYNPETKTTARKQTGSFYTPREIVNYMVDESLIAYFITKLLPGSDNTNEKEKEKIEAKLRQLFEYNEQPHQFDDSNVDTLINAIDEIKILDPAAGSGAFPMGILHRLVFLLHKLDPHNKKWKQKQFDKISEIEDPTVREQLLTDVEESFTNNELDYGRKLYLIENCIYGVDIQPVAVQIAKLRFFISLVVDQKVNPEKKNFGIRPLPNLETKFVAANTLIGLEKEEDNLFTNPNIDEIKKQLKNIRHRYFTARTHKTKEKYRKKDKELRQKLSELLTKEHYLQPEDAKMIAKWDPYDQNASSPFFDPEWMFGITDGLDVVIGNPPYIGEKGNKDIFRALSIGSISKRFYQRKIDIFYFFFHFALDSLKEGGVFTYITTNYFPTADAANNLRNDLKIRSSLLKLINFNETIIFESAKGQHNLITIGIKSNVKKGTEIINCKGKELISLNEVVSILSKKSVKANYQKLNHAQLFDGNASFIRFEKGNIIDILNKINNNSFLLKENFNVNQGILSGADKVTNRHIVNGLTTLQNKGKGIYVLTDDEIKELNFNLKEKAILKKFYKNSDVHKYYANESSKLNLLYLTRDLTISNYPNIKKHVEYYKSIINHRSKERGEMQAALKLGKWWVIFAARDKSIFEGEKLISPQRSFNNTFAYNNSEWFSSADVYYITKKPNSILTLKYILGLLNSKLYYQWLYHKGKRKGEMLELYATPLENIPVKKGCYALLYSIETLVNFLIIEKSETLQIFLQPIIDALVFELYFEDHMKEREIDILKYVEEDLNQVMQGREFEQLTDTEKEEVIEKLHKKWTAPDSIVRNRIKLMPIKSPDIIKPILES